MSQKKVLVVSAGIFPIPANRGGAVEELIDIFAEKNAIDNRYDVSITSCDYQGREIKEKTDGVTYFYFKTPFFVAAFDKVYYFYINKILKDWRSMFRQHLFSNRYYAYQITKRLDLRQFDVIVVQNNMSLLETLARELGEEFDKKCIYHMHSNLVDNKDMIPYLSRCRKILAVSDYVRNHLYETVPEFQNTVIEKVTNGIPIKAYSNQERADIRKEMRAQYGIADDETVYLFLGRISPEKGVLEMIRAFAKTIPELQHRSRLIIVGSSVSGSNEETHYYRQIKRVANAHTDEVILTGYIDHTIITRYHLMSDVQIVPSVFDDPAPLTVLEGMAMGVFLLLSRVGGIPEYSSDYENKIFFERDDMLEQHIAEAILTYDGVYAPHKYEPKPVIFDENTFYKELAEAIDI